MEKGIRLIRRMIALSLVLLLSIESFGAIVSDNDGSAFITKAEFDSLKNDFQSQIDQYNTSIDAKIDGAIAAYLAGIRVSKTTELTNNLTKLQNSYNVFWSNQTEGLVTTRVNYGSSYVLQVGARGTTFAATDARQAQAAAEVSGSFVNFPIISSNSAGGYDISYWEERKPWISYCGFFIANRSDVDTFMSSTINGIFSTNGFNPNTNNIFARQDQWWLLDTGGGAPWAMSIWGAYSTKAQNRDAKSIFIYPNASDKNTYCWNESETATSTGESNRQSVPSLVNNGRWSGSAYSYPQVYSGTFNVVGYTLQNTAKFPWCHTTFRYNELYDSRITTITGVRYPISNGLMVSEGEGAGVLKIKASGTASGALQVTIMNADNTSQLEYKAFTVSTSTQTFSIDLKTLTSKQKFNVWIKYLPSSKQQLYIDNIVFESEFD